jgi:hypothetical protein
MHLRFPEFPHIFASALSVACHARTLRSRLHAICHALIPKLPQQIPMTRTLPQREGLRRAVDCWRSASVTSRARVGVRDRSGWMGLVAFLRTWTLCSEAFFSSSKIGFLHRHRIILIGLALLTEIRVSDFSEYPRSIPSHASGG